MIPRRQRISLASTIVLTAFLLTGLASNEALADATFTFSGHDNDGNVAGTATFSVPADNELKVVITNTQSNVGALGQAISDLLFTLNGRTLVSNTRISGLVQNLTSATSWSLGTATAFDLNPPIPGQNVPPATTHWALSASGLSTVGTTFGGNPQDMILPSSGTVADGLSNSNQNPFYIGPTTFIVSVAGLPLPAGTNLTIADFSNVSMSFGTGPDVEVPFIPEPSSLVLTSLGLGALGLLVSGLRRRPK